MIILCITVFIQADFGVWGAELNDSAIANVREDQQSEGTQAGEQNPSGNTPSLEGTPMEGEVQGDSGAETPQNPEGDISGNPEVPAETVPESTPPLSRENVQEFPQEEMPGIEEYGEDLEFEEYIKEAQNALSKIAEQDPLMALIYLCDYYGLKREPDIGSEDLVWLPSGTTVLINGVALDSDYTIWYRVTVEHNGDSYTGYVDRNYLAYSNEIFTAWENNYFARIAMYAADVGGYPDIEQFPASYRDKLAQLKQAHPNWIFVRQNTGLDWQKVVNSENSKGRSLINSVMGPAYRAGYHSPGWYYASEAAVKYYLDPRNFLDETRIFQFEQLTYNSSYHSKAAVQNILNNTFMRGELPGAGMTYADAFFQVGVSLKVSPFHLACRVFQEQGEGKSALISGTYDAVPAYRGYYNYFNIGASGTTTKQVIESGLARAVKEGWNSPYASIKGGSGILSKSYILRGQDTLYLQKFDVDASDGTLYTHQYMQNIMAPYTESQMVRTAYSKINSLDNSFVFKIPVYENMPPSACPVPTQATPTATPTAKPTATPTATPTAKPTATPTAKPTATPTVKPTATPTAKPTASPTAEPTVKPTVSPTNRPTAAPTVKPTAIPGASATIKPTAMPTASPASAPTTKPTASPTSKPTAKPTAVPASEPTARPTVKPTSEPTAEPTSAPTAKPTPQPTAKPTPQPTAKPTAQPTEKPTAPPTAKPTAQPTPESAAQATAKPADQPASGTAAEAANQPTAVSNQPTAVPSSAETNPTKAPAPSQGPAASVQAEGTQTVPNSADGKSVEAVSSSVASSVDGNADLAGIQENTNSQGLTVAAATPKPQTAVEDTSIIDAGQSGTVYAETLKQIKDQGTKVALQMDDHVRWTIDGSTIESEPQEDVDMGVLLGTSQIPKEMLHALTENENYIEMSLAYEGAFGFTAQLSVKLDQAQAGQYANLFYYNEEACAFEFMCATQVSSTGRANYEFMHASDYVIVISDDTKETLLDERAQELAKAQSYIKVEMPAREPVKAAGIITVILLISAGLVIGVYLILRRKMEED